MGGSFCSGILQLCVLELPCVFNVVVVVIVVFNYHRKMIVSLRDFCNRHLEIPLDYFC